MYGRFEDTWPATIDFQAGILITVDNKSRSTVGCLKSCRIVPRRRRVKDSDRPEVVPIKM